jgi:hypothetical protein
MLDLTSFLSSNFGRYALQGEYSMNKPNDIHERTQPQQQKPTPTNIPSLMSLSITPPIMTTSIQQKSTTPTSVIKENIEPLPFPQHSPGPIQRPNRLTCQPTTQSSIFFTESTQSPSTPDVLVQINHLLDHQNSITTIPSTPNVSNSTNPSTLINDLATPNVPWTPFSPTEWSSKYDSSWPIPNIQIPNVSLTTQIQNPFAQQQISKEESTVWPTALGTATPRSTPSSSRTKRGAEWDELFSSTVPSSIEPTKPINNSWSKFLPVSDSPSVDRQENEANNPFWNPINLNETQPNSSTAWWPKNPSDENDDDKDQSRWDFAR